jgi:hypothetical protein
LGLDILVCLDLDEVDVAVDLAREGDLALLCAVFCFQLLAGELDL